jgi:hypothetical protein
MKLNITIDCTPEEARTFFGLPDLKPLQEEMLERMRGRMAAAEASLEPEALLRMWMSAGTAGFESMQKAFTDLLVLGTKNGS